MSTNTNTALRLAIIGDGKMGRAIASVAADHGIPVAVMFGAGQSITRDTLNGATVAIEFTEPSAAVGNIDACLQAGCPIVVGTTGWLGQLDAVTQRVTAQQGAMLWAANFSLGVYLFTQLAARAGELMACMPAFGAHVVETHHTAKKDAPSGTALMVRDAVQPPLGRDVPITSVRVGSVPGTHELIFDAPYEYITLTHTARDRRVFAEGAVTAASWLAAQRAAGRSGVFTLADLFRDPGADR